MPSSVCQGSVSRFDQSKGGGIVDIIDIIKPRSYNIVNECVMGEYWEENNMINRDANQMDALDEIHVATHDQLACESLDYRQGTHGKKQTPDKVSGVHAGSTVCLVAALGRLRYSCSERGGTGHGSVCT